MNTKRALVILVVYLMPIFSSTRCLASEIRFPAVSDGNPVIMTFEPITLRDLEKLISLISRSKLYKRIQAYGWAFRVQIMSRDSSYIIVDIGREVPERFVKVTSLRADLKRETVDRLEIGPDLENLWINEVPGKADGH